MSEEYATVLDAIERKDLVWVTVLEQNASGARPTRQEVQEWAAIVGNPRVLVLRGDDEQSVITSIGSGGWPSALVLRPETMRVAFVDVTIPGVLDEVAGAL